MKQTIRILFLVILILNAGCSPEESVPDQKTKTKEDFDEIVQDNSELDQNEPVQIPVINSPFCVAPKGEVNNAELSKWLTTLRSAVNTQDTSLLLSLMDSNIISSHGGGLVGFDDFKMNWKHGNLWEELGRLIEIGGSQVNDYTYYIPYFSNLETCHELENFENEFDPYVTYFSTSDTVNLYSEKSKNSEIKAKLVHTFLTQDYDHEPTSNGFVKLTTIEGGISGYVLEDQVYRTGDYDLFIQTDSTGTWRITSFAPYD
jgi:hypothetical protein